MQKCVRIQLRRREIEAPVVRETKRRVFVLVNGREVAAYKDWRRGQFNMKPYILPMKPPDSS